MKTDASRTPVAPVEFTDGEEFVAFLEREWLTDGLPIVLPTEERVLEMLVSSTTGTTPIGKMPPSHREVTLHHLAVNAVMAGCRPEEFRVVVAAVVAALDPRFNLNGIQATTNPAGVMALINGPIRDRLGIHSGFNLFGPTRRANATIGRAIRLAQVNIGGARPGSGDMSTLGNPNKFGSCIAENQEASPWEPYHVDEGFRAEQDVVTVAGVTSPSNICIMSDDPKAILSGIADSMIPLGSNLMMFTAQPLIVVGPVHAQHIDRAGWSKQDVQEYLWERATTPIDRYDSVDRAAVLRWKQRCVLERNGATYLRPTEAPNDIRICVAGGESGPHSAVLQPFNATHLVSRAIVSDLGALAAADEPSD